MIRRFPRGAFTAPCAIVIAVIAVAAQTPEPFRTPADRPVDVQHIRLDLKVDLQKKSVDGVATLKIESLQPINHIDLDAVEFEVKKVSLVNADGNAEVVVPFSHDGKKLTLDLDPAWPAGKSANLRIEYLVRNPRAGLYFFQPSKVEPHVPTIVWSQGEMIEARHWFPCCDHPGQKQTTELVVTAADGYEVLSNGKLLSKKPNDNGTTTWHWSQDKPHASYLVTLVVGKFDVVREDWRGREVSFYVPVGQGENVGRSFGRTREMIDVFSKRFGIEYPWDKYAQVVVEQFSWGGMENTSATTLNDYAIHDQRSLLDGDADGLISHELAHQWWGDLVTCKDWAHVWLNEGFASFAEIVWDEHRFGADGGALELYEKLKTAAGGDKDRPIVDRRYPSPQSMFDARAYPKGAWVLHMLRRKLGEDVFWKGIQSYGNEHRHKSVETSDFRKSMENVSGKNLERFFYDWTERPGHPHLSVTPTYLADAKQLKIVVKQTQSGEAFQFALPLAVYANGSSQPILYTPEVTEKEHTFFVNVPGRPRMVLVDPDLTLFCELTEDKGRDLWAVQLRESPTIYPRIMAANHFGKEKRGEAAETLAGALTSEKFWGVQTRIADALGECGGDASRDALIAGMNQQTDARVRRACATALGKFRRDEKATSALKAKLQEGDASLGVESALLSAYAKVQPADLVATLLPYLAKPSRQEVLRSTTLRHLGGSQDLAVLDTLIAWSQPGKPWQARAAALEGLANLAKTANPSDEQRKKIANAVAASLDNEGRRVRSAAVAALREMGQSATTSLPALEAIARHDPDGRVRDAASKAAEAIRSNSPAPIELTRLRDELDRLRKSNEQLQERLDRFERKSRKD